MFADTGRTARDRYDFAAQLSHSYIIATSARFVNQTRPPAAPRLRKNRRFSDHLPVGVLPDIDLNTLLNDLMLLKPLRIAASVAETFPVAISFAASSTR